MKDYTVIIVSFDFCSFFIAYVSAESADKAREKGVYFADGETGVPGYECIACFDGILEQSKQPNNTDVIFDWRKNDFPFVPPQPQETCEWQESENAYGKSVWVTECGRRIVLTEGNKCSCGKLVVLI